MSDLRKLSERSKQVRRDIIALSKANGGYHYGGTFSCVEILITLFDHILKPEDKLILSKGHSCWGLYVLLREKGMLPLLEGHPHRDPVNGITWTTGSMGHGLPAAVGIALARKMNGDPGKVYVIMGDGECQEGTTWESLLIAGRYHLDNLIVIVDNNGIQGSDFVSNVLPIQKPMEAVAKAADWFVDWTDGHNIKIMTDLFKLLCEVETKRPRLVLAQTTKGYGVSFMENRPEWHANWLGGDPEKTALEELK